MEIEFDDSDLEKLCGDPRYASRRLGAACAKKLLARYADLKAASKVGDLIAGNPHPLDGDRKDQFSISLAGGRRLTFVRNHPISQGNDDAKLIKWSDVSMIKVVYVGDYHD